MDAQSGASAIMIFHPSADGEGFSRWVGDLLASAGSAMGFTSAATSIHRPRLDWAVAVHFADEPSLHDWLDGIERQEVLELGRAQGFWQRAGDLVLAERLETPPGVSAFRHSVAPGKEDEFLTIQDRLAAASSQFPGYEGTVLVPPQSGQEWLSVLRFRTAGHLERWLASAERDEALPGLRSSLSKGFSPVSKTTPFGTTVRIEDGKAKLTPSWKSAMLVLMVLYPTVMLLSRFLGPQLDRLGAEPWLAMWLSEVASVSALQWLLMPYAARRMGRWLDPVDGAGWRESVRGAAIVVGVYVVTLTVFASVRYLQFWDYAR